MTHKIAGPGTSTDTAGRKRLKCLAKGKVPYTTKKGNEFCRKPPKKSNKMTVKHLRQWAKARYIKGYSKLKKSQLLDLYNQGSPTYG